jgi:hypothetical protein
MADPTSYPNTGGDSGAGRDGESTAGMPRWVKVLAIIALAVLLLFVILHLAFGGFGHHTPR